MRKIPKTWAVSPSKDPAFLDVIAPCGPILSRKLDARTDSDHREEVYHSFSRMKGNFFYEKGAWWKEFRVKNPEFIAPPSHVMIYGLWKDNSLKGGAVFCRFPVGLPWKKKIVPALNKVARKHGHGLYVLGDDGAYLEGAEPESWANPKFTSYDWDGKEFQLTSKSKS